MYQDTIDNKVLLIDNSIKQQKTEHMSQVEDIQKEHNELKEKVRSLEDRFRRDKLRIDGLPECKEEAWANSEELRKDALREKLGESKIQIERVHRAGSKDRTIVAKFSR